MVFSCLYYTVILKVLLRILSCIDSCQSDISFFYFQDFGINDIQDLANIFDKIVGKVVDPIKQAIDAFKNIINFLKNGGIQKLFNDIVDFIKNLPQILKKIAEDFVKFVMEAVDFGGFPIIQKIKNIVIKIRTFIEDVQEDVMGFYHVCKYINRTSGIVGFNIIKYFLTYIKTRRKSYAVIISRN